MEPTIDAESSDRPGVVALPPLIYLAGVVAAVVLDLVVPIEWPLPAVVRWLGAGLALAAIALAVYARASFARAHTAANPMEASTALVTSGVFRWTRNPMYVGMTTLVIGAGLITSNPWFLIALAPVLAIMHWGVVLREERYLTRKFGPDYQAYRSRVRRYL